MTWPLDDLETRFETVGELGEGGTASVTMVHDKNLRRDVARKGVHAQHVERLEVARVLLEEAQIAGQLEHPNIPPIYDLGLDENGLPRFDMKRVEGHSLGDLLDASDVRHRTAQDLQKNLQIFLKVCDAIAYAHSRGVVHRDLKPDNVMVGSFGQVYVMDWGFAKLKGGPGSVTLGFADGRGFLDAPGIVIGTGGYMAPEQARGDTPEIDERTDVFGLGAILYELLAGRPPYVAPTPQELVALAEVAAIEPPERVAPEGTAVPAGASAIAMRALAAQKGDRYRSVTALKEDIERFLSGGFWFATKTIPMRSALFRQGDPADAVYIITTGLAGVYKVEEGHRLLVRRMGPGEVFGEAALLDGQQRTADVVALEELTVMVVTREALDSELSMDSWMGALARKLAERFRALDNELGKLRQGQRQP